MDHVALRVAEFDRAVRIADAEGDGARRGAADVFGGERAGGEFGEDVVRAPVQGDGAAGVERRAVGVRPEQADAGRAERLACQRHPGGAGRRRRCGGRLGAGAGQGGTEDSGTENSGTRRGDRRMGEKA